MSRYSYQGREPSQHLAVGWDPVRGSFFGQLWAHPEQEEDIPLFVVGDEEIITDLTFLDAQLAPYGLFPHPYNQPCCRTGNSVIITLLHSDRFRPTFRTCRRRSRFIFKQKHY